MRIGSAALTAIVLSLVVAGCASPSIPPYQPPPSQTALPPPSLTSEQMAKLMPGGPGNLSSSPNGATVDPGRCEGHGQNWIQLRCHYHPSAEFAYGLSSDRQRHH